MPFLFDSSVYIQGMRRGGDAFLVLMRWAGKEPIWLSSVVLQELYAGADAKALKVVGKMEADFRSAERILVPNLNDWVSAGKILGRLASKFGYERIGRTRLSNDALIAVTAARAGMMLITSNRRDFQSLSEFCPLRWQEQSELKF